MDNDDYVCSLSVSSVKKAREELNEIPSDRLAAVHAYRTWIESQKHIKCPTDSRYLLKFLRARKFSQLEARKLLETYLIKKARLSHLCENLDPSDPGFLACLDRGACFLLPGFDSQGRRVMLMKLASEKPEYIKKTRTAMFRTVAILIMYAFLDENTQVNGIVNVLDLSGYGLAHQTAISVSERKEFGDVWQKSYPARVKSFHLYNLGATLEFFMSLLKLLLTDKLKNRVDSHTNLESLYRHVPMEMLPGEYLPDEYDGRSAGTTQQLLKKLKEEVTKPEVVERIKYLSSSVHRLDESLKPRDEPQQLFRRLNVD